MPVTGSSFALSWLMVHEGVMRRSDEAFSDIIKRGTSPIVCIPILWMVMTKCYFSILFIII